MDAVFVTKEFLNAQIAKLRDLDELIGRIRTDKIAAANGDTNTWHDNFAYEDLGRQEWLAKSERNDLAAAIESYVVCPRENGAPSVVEIWTCVRVIDDSGREKNFSIVPLGGEDPANEIYSYRAPLAAALLGARVGDMRAASIPSGKIEMKIIDLKRMA